MNLWPRLKDFFTADIRTPPEDIYRQECDECDSVRIGSGEPPDECFNCGALLVADDGA